MAAAGDNTDGIGLLSDLERLGFIKPGFGYCLLAQVGLHAAFCFLLSLDCAVTIVNRTYSRAHELATLFAHTGSVRALDIEALGGREFDLINATSSGIDGGVPAIPVTLINPHVCCYDMFYQKGSTPFLSHASNTVRQNALMGWECWWRRLLMRCCCGTAFCQKLRQSLRLCRRN